MENILGLVIGILIAAVISGAIIWLVSRLDLGLHVDGFGSAMIAGLLIGFITNLIGRVVTVGGAVGVIINIVVAAAVIFLCGQLLKGLTVKGFVGALIAAVAIAVIGLVLSLAVGGMVATTS